VGYPNIPQLQEGSNWDWEDYFFTYNREPMKRQLGHLICAQFPLSLITVYLGYTPYMLVIFNITIEIEDRDLILFCSQFFYIVPF
jgi:hypothetical protein